MKLYFVEYLEGRNDLIVSQSPTFVMRTSFSAGLRTTRNCGHRRKKDALAWVEKVNAAAGKAIAKYAGCYHPTPSL